MAIDVRIDACDEPLSAGLFIPSGSVDLSGEEKIPDSFRLERMVELRRVEEIVFNSITWSVYLHIAKCRNGLQSAKLDIEWERRRKSIQIIFLCVLSFRFQK